MMRKLNLLILLRRATFGICHLLFFLAFFPPSSLHSQPSISFDLDCSQGPGQARLEVESPLGGDWSYALNDGGFQSTPLFTDIFPGNHILIVRNTSGDRDTVRFNANCGLEPFACGDCDASDGFYQVYTQNGEMARLDLQTNQFDPLPNSPAGFHINATGLNPKDSLAYGIERNNSNVLVVIDSEGRALKLGGVSGLPIEDFTSGDFDSDGYLHVKIGVSQRIYKIDVRAGVVIETYLVDRSFRSNDIAYSVVYDRFYFLDNNGGVFSFSPGEKEVSRSGLSGLSGQVGAMYCDRNGGVYGIFNQNGRLYKFDPIDGSAEFILVTSSASYNDGFSCQNSLFIRPAPPEIQIECSSFTGRANLRITEPQDSSFEFKLNDGSFSTNRYYENLMGGEYEIIGRAQGGCFVDTSTITVEPMFLTSAEFEVTACDSFVSPSGQIWVQSGAYRDTILNSMGCDSIISYDITILNSSESFQVEEVKCADYEWNGMTLDSSGVYEFLTTNSVGCDSLARLDLTIVREVDTSFSASSCQSYSSPDGQEIWTSSGQYTDTLISAEGCDSIINIDLTILESTSSTQFAEACLTYSWKGRTLDSSGVYEFLTTNAAGCDSLVQLDLNIVTEVDTSFSAVSCRPYPSPDGEESWTVSGMYSDTLVTDQGCDSIITIDLWIGDIQADWQLFDPTCPDQLTTDLQIDSLSYSAPFLMIRNQLDTIVISDFPTRISDFPEGSNSFVFLSSDSCISEEFTVDIERLQEPEIRILGPSEVGVCDPATSFRLETSMPGEVQWSAPASLSCDTCLTTSLNPDSSGTIRVEFIAENECVATEAFFVQVNGIGDVQYFIPNVFSPNGDGINDYFTMFTGHGEVDQVELFEIYDRWGNRLFQRKNFFPSHESLGWNGTYQGSPLSTGVYVYHILYRYCDGSTHRIHGSVTLVR
jgi:gliding motility-associated-like protein